MSRLVDLFPDLLDALTRHYGRSAGSTAVVDPFEAVIRVPLERMLEAKKATALIEVFREDGFLDPQVLAEAHPSELADSSRNAGLKISDRAILPLRKLARWIAELHQGSADELSDEDCGISTSQLRDELLALSGIGPPTADAILLLALNRPVFPLDRASYRILVRHGWTDATADYDEARDVIERLAPDDPSTLRAVSSWFESLGSDFCKATAPKCDKCPLKPFLPESGPLDPSE